VTVVAVGFVKAGIFRACFFLAAFAGLRDGMLAKYLVRGPTATVSGTNYRTRRSFNSCAPVASRIVKRSPPLPGAILIGRA
jgi:hypothetical protein